MGSSTGALLLGLTAAYLLGTVCSRSYCGYDRLHTLGPYYWTDVLFLPNATDFVVASINGTKDAPTSPSISLFNDVLSTGPLQTDPHIGQVQGSFLFTDPDLVSAVSVFTYKFPNGTITFTGYFLLALLQPNQVNRFGINTGNGAFKDIIKGYTDLGAYSITVDGDQYILAGTVTYCLPR